MTNDEKAKAYDMALEWMRELYPRFPGAFKEEVEHYFPQLRESDDERIRKGLIEALKTSKTVGELKFVLPYPEREECIAYLEKQKYDRMKPIYDARESFESALEKAWNDYHNGYENVDKLEDDYVECAHAKGFREGYLFGLEKQKEQKPELVQHPPITFTYNSNASRDERLKAALLALLNSDLLKVKEGGYFTKQDLIEWVEKQKEPSWKPSEEHLSALLAVFNDPNNIGSQTCQLALTDLYEQLKKL